MRVALRGAEPRVAEQFLNGSKIGARLQEMRGEGVTDRVRADAVRDRRLADVAANDAVHAARRDPAASQIQEYGVPPSRMTQRHRESFPMLFSGNDSRCLVVPQHPAYRVRRGPPEQRRSLPPLPRTRTTRLERLMSSRSESTSFAQSKARDAIEQLENGAVRPAAGRRRSRPGAARSQPIFRRCRGAPDDRLRRLRAALAA